MANRSEDGPRPAGGTLAGAPGGRAAQGSARSLVLTWLAWWVVLMAFWVMLNDVMRPDELTAGALAAALAATLATIVGRQAGLRVPSGLRGTAWLRRAASLPGQVARDTIVVYLALGRLLRRGELPAGGYAEVPFRYGGHAPGDSTRRAIATWAASLAPNSFAVALDPDRDVQVVHRLVPPGERGRAS